MTYKKTPKNAKIFLCETCHFKCSKQSEYDRHLSTRKHQILTNTYKKTPKNAAAFWCECGNMYKHRQSLNTHKKKCTIISSDFEKSATELTESATQPIIPTDNKIDANLIKELIQQNRELQSQLVTLSNNKGDNITINNTNNTQNNKFNINVFLNEQCRNAINFTDFIDKIEVSHNDLEKNAELGFVNGISKILMDNLKQLTLHERPIHCTDIKRETMYIKDDNQWQKETVNEKMNDAIQELSRKSIRSLMDWKNDNPEYDGAESDFSNKCVVIQQHSLAGEKKDVYFPKVIHNLAKESTLNKDSLDK